MTEKLEQPIDAEQPIADARYAQLAKEHIYGDPKRRPGGRAPWFRMTSSASIGIEIAVAIVGCSLVARWLESTYTHWAPWTTLIGLGIGIAVSVKALIRTAKQYQREMAELEHEQAREGDGDGDGEPRPGAARGE